MPVDQTPITWSDGVTTLDDNNLNTEVRDAGLLLLNPPCASVRRVSGSQSIPITTLTAIVFDTLSFDTEDPSTPMWNPANNTRLTIRTPGWYEVTGTVEWTVTSGATFTASFRVNGATQYLGISTSSNPTLGFLDNTPMNLIQFAANDYIELMVTHNAASAQSIVPSNFLPCMSVARRRGV